MIKMAITIWVVLLALAILNGGVRTLLITPKIGERAGHVVSTITLCVVIILVTRISIGWVEPKSRIEGLFIGLIWVLLTVAFEFGAGHFAFNKPWEALLNDYNIFKGRIWILVLVTTLFAPNIFTNEKQLLEWRARRGNLKDFKNAMAKVKDIEPDKKDTL